MLALRLGASAVLVGTAAAAVLTGAQVSTLSDLQLELARGEVQQVRVIGEMGPGATGTSTVTLEWEEGRRTHMAEVRQRSTGEGTNGIPVGGSGADGAIVDGSVTQMLRDAAGSNSVTITPSEAPAVSFEGPTVLGAKVPGWTGVAMLVVSLLTLGLLIQGPRPRYATRWAWFWFFVFGGWVADLVFLLGAGPVRDEAVQDGPARRRPITGGWAFLACLIVVGPFLTSLGAGFVP